jgi:hypothetical protein
MSMPQAPGGVAPVNPCNALLGETPAQLSTALVPAPGGQRMALTIRTASTTVTVLLGAADAKAWAANITRTADQMSGSGLVVAGAAMPASGNGGPR